MRERKREREIERERKRDREVCLYIIWNIMFREKERGLGVTVLEYAKYNLAF